MRRATAVNLVYKDKNNALTRRVAPSVTIPSTKLVIRGQTEAYSQCVSRAAHSVNAAQHLHQPPRGRASDAAKSVKTNKRQKKKGKLKTLYSSPLSPSLSSLTASSRCDVGYVDSIRLACIWSSTAASRPPSGFFSRSSIYPSSNNTHITCAFLQYPINGISLQHTAGAAANTFVEESIGGESCMPGLRNRGGYSTILLPSSGAGLRPVVLLLAWLTVIASVTTGNCLISLISVVGSLMVGSLAWWHREELG
ncbi:hypothetical protein QBC45DRAFT_229429 [Copromyces sp. CBS 386.78]|nr:hypothetical protein QBC45DRAFT_229429 [Copromyces sp. CBS 386.78]